MLRIFALTVLLMAFMPASATDDLIRLDLELSEGDLVLSTPILVMEDDGARFVQGMEETGLILRYDMRPVNKEESELTLNLAHRITTTDQVVLTEGERTLDLKWERPMVIDIRIPESDSSEAQLLSLELTARRTSQSELETLRREVESRQ